MTVTLYGAPEEYDETLHDREPHTGTRLTRRRGGCELRERAVELLLVVNTQAGPPLSHPDGIAITVRFDENAQASPMLGENSL